MIVVAVRTLYVLEPFNGAGCSLFLACKPVVRGGSRLALFNHLARVEQNAFKAVIARILLGSRAAVALDYKVFVSHIIIIYIIPAESMHVNLRNASRNCDLVQIVAAEERRLTDMLNALRNCEV